MLSKKINAFLKENAIKNTEEYQKRYESILLKLHLNYNLNTSFLEFMTKYSDEYSGKYGYIMDVCNDMIDFESSVTNTLRNRYGVSDIYISLFSLELDDYLLYNIENDSVVLIDGGSDLSLRENNFSIKWGTFNEFLEDFFEL